MTSRSDGKGDPFHIGYCPHGELRYARQVSEGSVEIGRLRPLDDGVPEEGLPAGAKLVTSGIGEEGVRRVIEEIPLTGCRTRPATPAYRSGWDSTFGRASGKKGEAN